MERFVLVAVFLIWSSLGIALARTPTDLCVEVSTSLGEEESLRKLVLDELRHHPSHKLAGQGCLSTLYMDMFELNGVIYLTARINREVPIRHQIKDPKDMSHKLRDAISQVLSHDPIFLADDITHFSAVQRAAHSVLKRGHNVLRLELYQGLARGSGSAAFAPGFAVGLARGADHWQVYTRVYFGGWPGNPQAHGYNLQVDTGADIGLAYELSKLSNTSLYFGAGFGLQYLRYEGRVIANDPNSVDNRNHFGPTFHAKVGVRMLRWFDFECDFFAIGYLPMFGDDKDSRLEGFYPPTLQIGMGIGW